MSSGQLSGDELPTGKLSGDELPTHELSGSEKSGGELSHIPFSRSRSTKDRITASQLLAEEAHSPSPCHTLDQPSAAIARIACVSVSRTLSLAQQEVQTWLSSNGKAGDNCWL